MQITPALEQDEATASQTATACTHHTPPATASSWNPPGASSTRNWSPTSTPRGWQNPTPSGKYNLVVIGGGSAGLVAVVGAAGLGAKVALVEKSLLGGDCLNAGCVPSKAVIRSAKAIGDIRRAESVGVHVPDGVSADFAAIMERMRRIRAELSHHDSVQRFTDLGADVYLGGGRFTGPNTIEVAGQTLEFSKALIATGSRPAEIPLPGLAECGYLTNETLFSLTVLPPRLAVIGTGPIGSEMGQAFRRFGSEVTMFDFVPRLMAREDADAAQILQDVFLREGIRLALGSTIERIERTPTGKRIVYTQDGERREVEVDEILLAVGRTPNIDSLNLEAAGIDFHAKGVTVNDKLQTTNPNVYAAGDVALKYQFTHTADATARIVLQNALFPVTNRKASDLIVPWTTYTDPEIAHVGMYPAGAEEQGIAVDTFVQPIAETDRGRTDGDDEGFIKIHVKKGSDRILGATIVARHAGEIISEITVAMESGMGLKKLATVIHPYPTQAEGIRKVGDLYNRTRLTPTVSRVLNWWMARTR